MGSELLVQCARTMGLTQLPNGHWIDPTGYWWGERESVDTPTFVQVLENEIERRGLQELYAEFLHRQTFQWNDTLPMSRWHAIRATPEQRARAFLEAMKR